MGCFGLTVRVHDGSEPPRNYGTSEGVAYHTPPPHGPPPHHYGPPPHHYGPPPHGPHHYGPPPHGPGRF